MKTSPPIASSVRGNLHTLCAPAEERISFAPPHPMDLSPFLLRAERAITRRDSGEALGLVLEAWRSCRAPALAELIDQLSEQVAPPPDLRPTTPKRQVHRRWLHHARQLVVPAGQPPRPQPADVGVLLATVTRGSFEEVMERLEAIGSWPADPRVAMCLARMVEAPAFSANATRERLWAPLLHTLGGLGDVRVVPILEQALAQPKVRGALLRSWLASELPRVIRAIQAEHRRAPVLSSADRLLCRRLAQRISTAERLEVAAARTAPPGGDALLAQVLDHPEDDGLRQVFGDWLLERGDARGEFIALQFQIAAGTCSPEGHLRASSLLKQHWSLWLGDLAMALKRDECTFEKGFLSRCVLGSRFTPEWVWPKVVGHPLLATVTELVPNRIAATLYRDILTHPVMRSLEAVEVDTKPLLATACEHPFHRPLQGLGYAAPARQFTAEAIRLVEKSPAARSLRRVWFRSSSLSRASVERLGQVLAESPLTSRLESLGALVAPHAHDALGAWLSQLGRLPESIRSLTAQSSTAFGFVASRAPDGSVALEVTTDSAYTLGSVLVEVEDVRIQRLVVRCGSGIDDAERHQALLQRGLERLRSLGELELPEAWRAVVGAATSRPASSPPRR